MNLALPALVLVLGILPGIAFFYGYFAGRFDKRTAGLYGGEEIAFYVLFAIPIDVAALVLLRRFWAIDFDFGLATHLLTGSASDAMVLEVATKLQAAAVLTAGIYIAVLALGYGAGAIVRRTVWAFWLDTYAPILQLRHTWFYVLQGRLKTLPRGVVPYADVLTSHGNDSLLYQGIVLDFEISSTGAIDSLTLIAAKRGSGRGPDFKWKDIPSNRFTIMGATIHSINMRYVSLDVKRPERRWDRCRQQARICLRSWLFQEP